ncbi:hypothetical protein [Streptomyces noursei]|uniref:hypothetical protein n=1 Tax=Streptomyces noursei TaxID=1971 RepID=UPI00167A8649|nr:hypothetical protein [Streptomyces noursei]MCZ1021108.1 hypothetical protein [Streptomyces noursei]MCZ1021139.1 hypothetical protein [Streptomyces noursei]MCZ1021466.1 hypothetical protein [Streptomyces noursei]GGX51450.1 hypothetical protein GCM10010341_86190 [Streptomyces noursei]
MASPLAELLARAGTGAIALTDPDGNTVMLPAGIVARLWTAVADDRTALGLHGMGAVGELQVELEDAFEGVAQVTVAGVLRYDLDVEGDALRRLCAVPGCYGDPLGTAAVLTRMCAGHLGVVVPGLLPSAGDDIGPGDRESAAAESRRMRLDAWEAEISEVERQLRGDRGALGKLREQ